MATCKLSVKPYDMLEMGGGGGKGGAAIVCHPIQVDKKTSAHFMLRNRDNFWHLRQSHMLKFHSK